MTEQGGTLQIVGPRDQFPKVALMETIRSGYLTLALEVDHRPPIGYFVQSRRKTALMRALKTLAAHLSDDAQVLDATVFKATIIPPGRGSFLKKRPDVPVARFDVVMLIEFVDLAAAQRFAATAQWAEALAFAKTMSHRNLCFTASNVRRIGPVDHSYDGVFLFNFFYADSLDINLKVWTYTAGWFQDQTNLDNSTVLLPEGLPDPAYTIINHCRWDRYRDILPSIIFNRTFKTFVLANFEKNNTAPIPILYKLA